jgi:glycyl-tRNA synthetase
MPENVFKASGHLESFVDPIVKCKKCGTTERADHIIESELKETFEGLSPEDLSKLIKKHRIKCPKCKGPLDEAGILNMMFPIDVGTGSEKKRAYLSPETAQGAYLNFKREFECLRRKLPLGLAILGKAYRNEISPRNALIRMREFSQAELQIFFDPDKINEHNNFKEVEKYKLRILKKENREKDKIDDVQAKDVKLPKFYVYHMVRVQQFFLDILKIPKEKFRFKELNDEEKAFYNKYHWDVEIFLEDIGWKEVAGVHYRTSHDLDGHQKVSKQDMSVSLDAKKFVPHVLELSFGIDRNIYALLILSYDEDKERVIFRFPRSVAPYDAAVFPLVNKDNLPEAAKEMKELLQNLGFGIFYDESGSIGRRYRRMDEIGVAATITIDHQTLEDGTVTLRDRDTMDQVRIKKEDLCLKLKQFLDGESIERLGAGIT